MKTIPKLDGFEYTKVEPLTDNQRDLAVQALGYALGELGLHEDLVKGKVLETFVSYLKRGEIL
jgi:hypothetical protein